MARAKNQPYQKLTTTTGIKFKLDLSEEEGKRFDEYFSEYAKAVNFCAKVIYQLRKNLKFAGKKELAAKEWKFEISNCDFCNKQKEIYYKNIANGQKVCKGCHRTNFSDNAIRKKMIPVKGRKVESKFNIHNTTKKISGTHRHWAFEDAADIIESMDKQRKEKQKRLRREKRKLSYFFELFGDPAKRYELPKVGKQRVPRYLHKIIDKDSLTKKRGYSLSYIKNKIKISERNIERDEKSLRKASPIAFGARKIKMSKLDPKRAFDLENNVFKIPGKVINGQYKFFGTNVANEHGKKFYKDRISKILAGKPKYFYLLRKKVAESDGNPIFEYYVQWSIDTETPAITSYDNILGIDAGITNLATTVLIPKNLSAEHCSHCGNNHVKPIFTKFFSGKELKAIRIKSRKQKYFLRGKHNKLVKIKRIRPIEQKVDGYCHVVSKQIVEMAKERNSCIALEKLEKPKKSKFRQRRREKYAVSMFVFKKLATFIKYKAAREGIEIIPVEPEGTSYTCSHCKNAQNNQRPYFKPNSKKSWTSMFKCGKCGIELNSDYNAAFNIAQKALNMTSA